jgi:hypothetical protein
VPASVALAQPLVEGHRSRWLAGSAIVTVVSVVILYIWDDALLAAPIIAVTGLAGPWVAFVTFSLVYGLVSYALALLAVRAYDRRASGRPSRLAAWLNTQGDKRRTAWAKRFLDSGKVAGFVISSFALGGIVTTWLIRYGGRRDGIERIAALSCAIFGVTFTGMYTGLAQAVFSI